tara:strand:+ start:208 stop:603 length:396 start_codon:yes stop_codon:yes gene_type:complete
MKLSTLSKAGLLAHARNITHLNEHLDQRCSDYRVSIDTSANRVTEQIALLEDFRKSIAEKKEQIKVLNTLVDLKDSQLATCKSNYENTQNELVEANAAQAAYAHKLSLEEHKTVTLMEVIVRLHIRFSEES